MIEVHCRTNLDDFKREIWPKQFCCRPMVGDSVQSEIGQRLRIVAITHGQVQTNFDAHRGDEKYKPILMIELNK